MPLPISSSDPKRAAPATRTAVAWLVVSLVALLAATEGTVRFGFDRISRIQARTRAEWQAALAASDGRRPVVLLVGNSLLGTGVDPSMLSNEIDAYVDARRLVVEDTRFLDWYFGARRLSEDGARPHVLALVLSESQFLAPGIRGDYSARYLFTWSDTYAAAKALHADRNRTVDLLLAHMSAFWGVRAEAKLRSWLLGQLAPALPEFLRSLGRSATQQPDQAAAYEAAKTRMRAMADSLRRFSCEWWGSSADPRSASPR